MVCLKPFFVSFSHQQIPNTVYPLFPKIFKFAEIFKNFDHSPLLPKALGTTERCSQKCAVKHSVVFVFEPYGVSLAKKWRETSRFGNGAKIN